MVCGLRPFQWGKIYASAIYNQNNILSNQCRHLARMASMLESKVEERKAEKPVDREKTCPFLLRVFPSTGRHNNINEYRRCSVPANELQVYTWMNASLNELCLLILEVHPEYKRKGTIFEFSLVILPEYQKPPIPRMKDLGTLIVGQKGFDDNKTLAQCGFTIGDYLDIAIINPQRPPQRRMRQYYSESKNY